MDISIIIPCRNEGGNVELIAGRIAANLPEDLRYEIWFVDDSTDDTTERLAKLSRDHPRIRYLHREGGSGLASAVLDGFALAKGDWFVVMDADLQHPPESLRALVEAMRRGDAELIIPSRFVPGGSDGGLGPWRKLVSWTARWIARLAVRRLLRITDPTSGYFAVRRSVATGKAYDPIGWKVLLELIVRGDYDRVIEIPYAFEARDLGQSKFGLREQWLYLVHLTRLVRGSEEDLRFWKFCAVGGSGVLVNSVVYMLLVQTGMPVTYAYASAALVAMISNFVWNNLFTWNRAKTDRLWFRLAKFLAVSVSGLALSSAVVSLAHHGLGLHYLIAGLSGIAVSTGWNFTLHNVWTFKNSKKEPTPPPFPSGENVRPGHDGGIRHEA